MSELVWGKKIMPLGNIVQESHKMQMVPLNRTYIDLFSFWEEERDPPLSVAEMCQLELNPQFWMPLKFGSWSRPWIASLSFIEQINSAELPSPFRLQQCSDLFVLCASCTSSLLFPLLRVCQIAALALQGLFVSLHFCYFIILWLL